MSYERKLVGDLLKSLSKKLPVFQVLCGPRQVGKTTIARQIIEKISFPSLYATADSPYPLDYNWIDTQFRLAEIEESKSKKPVLLVLDEIQKIKGWSEVIKFHWDNIKGGKKDIRLLILESSSLLLQQGLSESLAGRFFLNRCMHWSYTEMKEAFGWDLNKWVYFGGYPGSAVFVDDEERWNRYIIDSLIETVLIRDVLEMQKITKPILLRHLFSLSATFPAQVISYNKMLGQLQDAGNTTTLAGYIKLLEFAFLLSGLELFSKGSIRKRGSSPKFIFWNNALVTALSMRKYESALGNPFFWGRLIENAVGAHLLNNLLQPEFQITYWRDGNYEVDFVVTTGKNIFAIEVKSGRTGKLSGIERFKERYKDAKAIVIGTYGIPFENFFSIDPKLFFTQ